MANQRQQQVAHDINLNKKGVSLLEIIISAVIVAMVVTGVVGVFVSGRKLIVHSRNRISAAELGKKFIDPIQAQVRQDQWGTNSLTNGSTISGSSGSFNYSYVSSALAAPSTARKVITTITWNTEE